MITAKPDRVTLTDRILEEKNRCPDAQLKDYYKLAFQALFGPGHFIKDRRTATRFLEQELNNMAPIEDLTLVDLSFHEVGLSFKDNYSQITGNYCRVSLSVIDKKIISFEDYLDAFIVSANRSFSAYSKEKWIALWSSIDRFIQDTMKHSPAESSHLMAKIDQNSPISRHSNTYRKKYHPHYRIIHKPLLEL